MKAPWSAEREAEGPPKCKPSLKRGDGGWEGERELEGRVTGFSATDM